MKRYTPPVIFIGLAILFAVLVMPYTADPEIYAISDVEEAGIFKNPIALKQISQEKTADLQPLMQDFFDSSGTIVLNVRFKNFEDAEEDLAEYRRAAKQFDHMVINLDMSESEIGEFRKNNADNLRNLEELINDSVAFDELNRLEIQYQNEDNPAMMYSIAYEGEALREKLKQEFAQYQNHTAAMSTTGRAIEVDPQPMESSVDVFEEYINEIEGIQEKRVIQASETSTQTHIIFREELTLSLHPSGGVYGDEIEVGGKYTRTGDIPAGETVILYIDSREYIRSSCTNTGDYAISFPIKKMYTGTHLLYTRAGDVFSPVVPVSVSDTNGTITLNASISGNRIFAHGNLSTDRMGVSGAPVTIYFVNQNNITPVTLSTDNTGAYSYETEVEPGEYTLFSVFSDPAYPIQECRSDDILISVGQTDLYLFLIPIVIIAAAAGYLIRSGYSEYRRRYQKEEHEQSPEKRGETDMPEESPSYEQIPESSEEKDDVSITEKTTIQNFRSRYLSERMALPPADAARILGEGFSAAIASATGQVCRPSDTMRELTAKLGSRCQNEGYAFVFLYEAIVYGNERDEGDTLLLAWDEALQCIGDI